MNNLEKYLDQVIVEKPIGEVVSSEPESRGASHLIGAILRRWYIVMLVFILLAGAGIPAVWLFIKPLYSVTGAIKVAPVLTKIISGEKEDLGGTSAYESFVNTQAEMIVSTDVVQRVADELKDKNLTFFEDQSNSLSARLKQTLNNIQGKPDIAAALKQAILDGVISATQSRRSQLIKVTVQSPKPREAEQIVDSFIRNYMAVEGTNLSEERDSELATLEDERKVLEREIASQRDQISSLAQEFGDANLAPRHDMKLQRVAKLLTTLTEVEARRIYLEAHVKILETKEPEPIPPQEMLKMREEYVNRDPALAALTANIVQLEQDIIVARQTYAAGSQEVTHKEELLAALEKSFEAKKKQTGKDFDELIAKEAARAGSSELLNAQTELEQTRAYEKQLSERLAKEDIETIGLGRTQIMIQNLRDQMAMAKELKEKIERRIQELKLELKRPGRVTIAYYADTSYIRDKRVKYSAALVFGGLALGSLLAYLRDKADHSVRTAEDVARHIGVRVLGTTTSSQTVKPARLPELVTGDYQTIRANLGLLNGSGMPRKLVVTSPGMREGKTTFCINLALSMSRSGKKVLLIDGDLRKPDIAHLLGLPKGSLTVQSLLSGRQPAQAVLTTVSEGLDVLGADIRKSTGAFELLASPQTAQLIETISGDYEHVIIDTPPMLAFPDALLWARIGDAVILTCFAGQTKTPDLKEAKKRLAQANAKLLGTVLSNVDAGQSYYHYGYSYYGRYARARKGTRRARRKMLLPLPSSHDNTGSS
ncbi:MAG: polysaccharide biosynthesis tyrosine autokinase [Phycisphaerales bacterium]|nr:MAG: polysaccharide biosynthesis tyrosine autokinase [Phycisphaerales bacterium]